MATVSNNTIARAIYLASKDKSPHEQSQVAKQVVEFLSRKHLLSKASSILAELQKITNEETGTIVAHVASAETLGEKVKKELAHQLKERYGAEKVVFEEKLDARLIGGFRVEVNNEVIDVSIKHKINTLQAYLTRTV